MGRRAATAAAVLSAVALGIALFGLSRGGDPGVSDRVVESFGEAPAPAPAPTGAAPALTIDGTDLAPLPEAPGPAASRLVPVRSGLIANVATEQRAAPVGLVISDIGLAAPVGDVGYDAAEGEMEVPRSPAEVGWYRFGASPGQAGSAVLAAHVDFNGIAGAFYDLHRLEAGDRVMVVMDDGTRQRWEVVARRQYGKQLLPTDAIFARSGEPTLALITCGGPFDGRRYEDNVVVFARPAGAPAADPGPA